MSIANGCNLMCAALRWIIRQLHSAVGTQYLRMHVLQYRMNKFSWSGMGPAEPGAWDNTAVLMKAILYMHSIVTDPSCENVHFFVTCTYMYVCCAEGIC